jgi:hypothetical protein
MSRILVSLAALLAISVALTAEKARAQAGGVAAGVLISPDGVLHSQIFGDPSGMLHRQRVEAAKAGLPGNVKAFSKLRWISLTRLEKALAARQNAPTDEMKYLAGLLRIRYVFCYPQSGDVVIGGPAEGWMTDPAGRVIGLTSGRPVVQLQDLAVALRAFPPGDSAHGKMIGCSIDPTKEGLAAMQQFLRQVGGQATPGDTQYIVTGLKSSLGLQTVSISGVSPKTNFARIMVEADYRMKLIGIGLEQPPVRMVSFVQSANPAQISRNALFRWYFIPDYQCVRTTEDRLGMELVGDGVKLVGEDELVSAGGHRSNAGGTSKASQMFTMSFTKHYPELAERSPVYAELRNVIDLSVAAAFIQRENYYHKADWSLPVLGNEESYAVERQPAPRQVESAVTAIWKGNRLTTPIGGGVQIHPDMALSDQNRLSDESGKVSQLRQGVKIDLPPGRWWWE